MKKNCGILDLIIFSKWNFLIFNFDFSYDRLIGHAIVSLYRLFEYIFLLCTHVTDCETRVNTTVLKIL